jgi:hypothetical protein
MIAGWLRATASSVVRSTQPAIMVFADAADLR